jgi:hypothetical protein
VELAAGADEAAIALDRPVQEHDRDAVTGEGERGGETFMR